MAFDVQAKWQLGPNVVQEVIDGEVVAINLDSGSYYSVRGGAQIWRFLVAGASASAIADVLDGEATAIAAGIASFVDTAVAEGLLVANTGGQTAGTLLGEPRVAYTPPEIEKFEDLADMFMIDPIHDVTEAGWPHAVPVA